MGSRLPRTQRAVAECAHTHKSYWNRLPWIREQQCIWEVVWNVERMKDEKKGGGRGIRLRSESHTHAHTRTLGFVS